MSYDTASPVVQRLTALTDRIEHLSQQMTAGSQGDAENVEAVEQQTAALLAGLSTVRDAMLGGNPLTGLLDGVESLLSAQNAKLDALTASLAKPAPWNAMAANGAMILDATSKLLKASPGAGLRNYMTNFQVRSLAASEAIVQVLDGSTVIWSQPIAAGSALAMPVALTGSANAALNVRLGASVALGVSINAQGYVAP